MSDRNELPGDFATAARHAEELGFESVWVVDQLVAGAGAPFIESTVALAAAASVTTTVKLGFGVLIVPLRSPVWIAKQVASLQHLSGQRVILGIGAGGDRHDRSWDAAGVPRRGRGRRTDATLRILPELIAGKAVQLEDGTTVELAPPATVPPIMVGGMSDAAVRRVAEFADDWFLLPTAPAGVVEARARIAAAAAERGRPAPRVTASMMTALHGDPSLPSWDEIAQMLSDPAGRFGMPAEAVPDVLTTGDPSTLAERLAAYAAAGAHRVVVTFAAGDWQRQAELLAEADAMS